MSRSRQVAAHQALDPGALAQFEEAGLLQTFPRRHDAFAAEGAAAARLPFFFAFPSARAERQTRESAYDFRRR
ncbi:MAG: hypothetical protein LBU11_00465, partial [Zoogloeaceae bacterium]|nr:hypothetical protein [Zoogloeaceae bacterium]